ncbi:MAG: glutaredoxin family protein [Candidatus Methanoperedens sp.]|nr:glutaredoxin family protein [Candidatus Methanoperedens sp.]MDP2841994.1 glutaredoxin family protein [Candidatus Methanoperedens sp.]
MVNITIYSKNNCHLCNIAMETLLKLQKEFPFSLIEVDIEKDKEIFEKYKYLIPVIEIDGKEVFTYRVNENELKKILSLSTQPR